LIFIRSDDAGQLNLVSSGKDMAIYLQLLPFEESLSCLHVDNTTLEWPLAAINGNM